MKFIAKLKFLFPILPLAFHLRNCPESLKLIERFLFCIFRSENNNNRNEAFSIPKFKNACEDRALFNRSRACAVHHFKILKIIFFRGRVIFGLFYLISNSKTLYFN